MVRDAFGYFDDHKIVAGGSITVIIRWLHCADHQVASLRRSQGGSIAVIMEWLYSIAH
jgi:hypothetical protein